MSQIVYNLLLGYFMESRHQLQNNYKRKPAERCNIKQTLGPRKKTLAKREVPATNWRGLWSLNKDVGLFIETLQGS